MPSIDEEVQLTQLEPTYIYSDHGRNPQPAEILSCQSHIDELIKTFRPEGIVYIGQLARNSYLTNRKCVTLEDPINIAKQEYKVIPMRKEARKLYDFIREIRG